MALEAGVFLGRWPGHGHGDHLHGRQHGPHGPVSAKIPALPPPVQWNLQLPRKEFRATKWEKAPLSRSSLFRKDPSVKENGGDSRPIRRSPLPPGEQPPEETGENSGGQPMEMVVDSAPLEFVVGKNAGVKESPFSARLHATRDDAHDRPRKTPYPLSYRALQSSTPPRYRCPPNTSDEGPPPPFSRCQSRTPLR